MADKFRAGTAAVIFRKDGKVLAFKRTGEKKAWQMPQGGLKKEEDVLDGVLREIHEETHISSKKLLLVAEYPEWLVYVFPREMQARHNRGQAQKWFLFEFTGVEKDINLNAAEDDEFDEWCWMMPEELIENIIPFKRRVYLKVFEAFKPLMENHRR